MVGTMQLPAVAVANRKTAIERLADYGLVLPDKALAYLSVYEDVQTNNVLAACLALGLKFEILQHEANVKAMINCLDLVHNYRYVPGRDFYGIPFKGNETDASVDDDSSQSASKSQSGKPEEKIPTVAVMLSYQTCEHNVNQHGLLYRISYYKQVLPVDDREQAAEIIENTMGDKVAIPSKQNRVCQARFVPIIGGIPYPDMATWSYGIYLAEGMKPIYNGKPGQYTKQYGLAKASNKRPGSDIALTRAIRSAAKMVTTSKYPMTNLSAAETFALMMRDAERTSARVERALRDGQAETIDDAIELVASGDDTRLDTSQSDKEWTQATVSALDDGPKANGKPMEISSTPEPAVVEVSLPAKVVAVKSDEAEIPTEAQEEEETELDRRLSRIHQMAKKDEFTADFIRELSARQMDDGKLATTGNIDALRTAVGEFCRWEDYRMIDALIASLAQTTQPSLLKAEVAGEIYRIIVKSRKTAKGTWVSENYDSEKYVEARKSIGFIQAAVEQEFGYESEQIPS